MTGVRIIGTGMTRFGKYPDGSIRTLAEEATRQALDDAGVLPSDVGMVFFANAAAGILSGQEMIRGQVALRYTGLSGVPIVNVENACASGSSGVHLASMAIRSGSADVVLVVGSEKLTHEDKARSFAAIGTALDLLDGQRAPSGGDDGAGTTRSPFMDLYARRAQAYMAASGATPEDFAAVAVKSHFHGSLNPNAQYRALITVEEVLASRIVAEPLRLLMCSPIGDGAAAVVVCSEDFAKRRGQGGIQVRSSALFSGRDRTADNEPTAVQRAVQRAYAEAGIAPEDIDVVELHDAAAPAELSLYEDLQLCEPGKGPDLLRSGATRLGGTVPVNPSGGLLSRGHPIGATGCAQLVELVDQLRGRGGDRQVPAAKLAVAENSGGRLDNDSAAAVVTVLSR